MPRWMMGLRLIAAFTVTTGVLACRQVVGITGNPPEALTSTFCGLPYGTSACATCVDTSCCSESTACAADPVCSAYEVCLGGCSGDPACRSQCTIDHPTGTASDVSALSACLASKCETACALPCGAMADLISEPDAAAGCQTCLSGGACSLVQTCASSEPCDAYMRANLLPTADLSGAYQELQCASSAASGFTFTISGSTVVCGETSSIDVDAGSRPVASAFVTSCATPCQTGNYWACVGKVSWPAPNASTATLHYTVNDFVTKAHVSMATVKVCQPYDPGCSPPLDMGTTDMNGQVSLTVPNAPDSSEHGLNSFVQISSPTLTTSYAYWGFPLVAASFSGVVVAATPAEVQELWTLVGIDGDSTRGTLIVQVEDCRYQAAPGVQVTLTPADPLTQEFSTTAMPTTATDPAGLVVFTNVPAGPTQVTATPLALHGKSSGQVSINIQPGTTTLAVVPPTPD